MESATAESLRKLSERNPQVRKVSGNFRERIRKCGKSLKAFLEESASAESLRKLSGKNPQVRKVILFSWGDYHQLLLLNL
jgi:predicted nucleotidyltransferase